MSTKTACNVKLISAGFRKKSHNNIFFYLARQSLYLNKNCSVLLWIYTHMYVHTLV